jgi:hypothetical protein
MPNRSIPLIEVVPQYRVRRDIMRVTVDGEPLCAFPLDTFEAGMAAATLEIVRYRSNCAEVVRLPTKRRRSG